MKKKLKGFTLIELIVVIAILGVIIGLLVPNWINMIRKNRIEDQNSRARVVYNAAQTVVQEYRFDERNENSGIASVDSVNDGDFIFMWDCRNGGVTKCYSILSDGTNEEKSDAFKNAFSKKINNIFDGYDDTTYKVYVKDYIVQSVVCRKENNNKYMGAYPTKIKNPRKGATVEAINMTAFNLNDKDDTNTVN